LGRWTLGFVGERDLSCESGVVAMSWSFILILPFSVSFNFTVAIISWLIEEFLLQVLLRNLSTIFSLWPWGHMTRLGPLFPRENIELPNETSADRLHLSGQYNSYPLSYAQTALGLTGKLCSYVSLAPSQRISGNLRRRLRWHWSPEKKACLLSLNVIYSNSSFSVMLKNSISSIKLRCQEADLYSEVHRRSCLRFWNQTCWGRRNVVSLLPLPILKLEMWYSISTEDSQLKHYLEIQLLNIFSALNISLLPIPGDNSQLQFKTLLPVYGAGGE
jgi:hypothetical protein